MSTSVKEAKDAERLPTKLFALVALVTSSSETIREDIKELVVVTLPTVRSLTVVVAKVVSPEDTKEEVAVNVDVVADTNPLPLPHSTPVPVTFPKAST